MQVNFSRFLMLV